MAEDRTQHKPPKRRTLPPADSAGKKASRAKRKKMAEEEAPVSIADDNIAVVEKQKNKAKKHKKREKTQQAETAEQISVPAKDSEGDEDLSQEERRVLERKMKKLLKKEEKNRLKADGITLPKTEASAGPTAAQQALDYLACWADNRAEWRFRKTRQTWLLQHMFDSDKVPDDNFSVLLEYMEGLRGGARDTTVQKALDLVKESGQEDLNVHKRAQRAREVIQMLT